MPRLSLLLPPGNDDSPEVEALQDLADLLLQPSQRRIHSRAHMHAATRQEESHQHEHEVSAPCMCRPTCVMRSTGFSIALHGLHPLCLFICLKSHMCSSSHFCLLSAPALPFLQVQLLPAVLLHTACLTWLSNKTETSSAAFT